MTAEQVKPGLMPAVFAGAIRHALEDEDRQDVDVQVFDSLPSTSEYLSEISRGASSDAELMGFGPRLCVADWQTRGTGRRGKVWQSSRGNITFSLLSVLEKPPAELMGLSLVTGVCIARVLLSEAGLDVGLKWPNDVIVAGAKLGGVLLELQSATTPGSTRVITGIGINYRHVDVVDQSGISIASLEDVCPDLPSRTRLIGRLTTSILEGYDQFIGEGWKSFANAWDALDYLKGREVSILHRNNIEQARAVGVNEAGALLVESDGYVRPLYSGDVSVRLSA
jgi:BirA family biotin operon repressor/biotin-[acetyl-CoA-carboxylase] ligase